MFLSDKAQKVSKAQFDRKVKEVLQPFPKPAVNQVKTKDIKFRQEYAKLQNLIKSGRKLHKDIREEAFEHFQLMHMYSEMIELTVPKDRGSMRGRFRKEKKKYESNLTKANALSEFCQNPYFGRIDFKFSNETKDKDYRNKELSFYIGKKGNTIGDQKITDWRSPIASIYYNFPKPTPDCFYKTDKTVITGDLKLKRKIEIEEAQLKHVFDGKELTSLVGSDPFLLKQLNKNASSELKDIISTIQSEQNKIISLEPENDIIVQGVAGSGKTSIAIHRLSWLLYNYKDIDARKCLIIAPSRLFLKYIKKLLPEIGSENVPQATFNEWAKGRLKDVLNGEEITTEIDLDTDEYQKQSSMKFMRYIEKISKRFKGKNIRSSEILPIYKRALRKQNISEYDLAPLLYLKILIKGVNPNEKIHYLVVDEAQDHSPAEIFTLKKFADTGRTMIVGDLLQGIVNPNGIQSWEDIMEKMYDTTRTEFFRIKTSYRSTRSIIEFVNEYLTKRGIPLNHLPRPVLREGEKPTVYIDKELENIIERIVQINKREIQKKRNNIAIIVPEKFLDIFKKGLENKLENLTLLNNNTKYDGGTALGHVRTFKGLEFDTVIFINIAETIDPQIQNKNFYVACTRAMHSLYIINN